MPVTGAPDERFRGYLVRRAADGGVTASVETINREALPAGDVLIAVDWSSVNYKDGLAAQGHPGVVHHWPHVPGIDAAGVVVASQSERWQPGQAVIVTGNELGAGQWGGWCRYIRVPASWIVALPTNLTPRAAMIHGTAGFTAAQCVRQLQRADVMPGQGPVLVTGATGGVGCLAVMLLKHLGYDVVASTGKLDAADWLRALGAVEVVDRQAILNSPDKPLAAARWAGAVDTVGGATLASILRATKLHGCVTACGVVGGAPLPTSVFPFILRGVTLAGITSQNCPLAQRAAIWHDLATDWYLPHLERVAHEVTLDNVAAAVQSILAGQTQGRTLVRIGTNA